LKKPFTKKGWGSGSRCRPWVQVPVLQKEKKKSSDTWGNSWEFPGQVFVYGHIAILISWCWRPVPKEWQNLDEKIMDLWWHFRLPYFWTSYYLRKLSLYLIQF
jgi:hypothetical protein